MGGRVHTGLSLLASTKCLLIRRVLPLMRQHHVSAMQPTFKGRQRARLLEHRWDQALSGRVGVLLKRSQFHAHFTLASAWWLNVVEWWFASLTKKQIRHGPHRSTEELQAAIKVISHMRTSIPTRLSGPKRRTRFWPVSLGFVGAFWGHGTSRRSVLVSALLLLSFQRLNIANRSE